MTLAIFPGSFDPLTNGHLDLIERALEIFDRVHVAVLVNQAKKPLFTAEERIALIRETVPDPRVEIHTFSGLLVDFAREHRARVIIRGLRAVSDFEYELQMAMMNRELSPDLETVFLTPRDVYSYLSSRLVKEVASLGADVSRLVPPTIRKALALKYSTEGSGDSSRE